ncbi:CRISPR-associated protein, Csa1 family [Sulfolobus islandicus Y.G.57.14]|jgi:CRISPR-associated protein Csa1|uniref:CRISPR-associated protein, Csa1 family n=2 Tax=Saccharolobus islandicus TaxID=43080 RepID=C3NC39_SACI7|nr:type I-A CRISPR-associated protein Cas4/Csa1 [Sulfolobus islandicus]ACP45047.1 CRISPR-associated protein, Csa1 family [Sulfolobus islandicus Y.G.57.14]ACP49143.1 CRISPR-associated protein, Csa1 family [Sulfolobus islandicus Y.N.15.51]
MYNVRSQIIRQVRRLHSYRASDPIEEELRGWNYHMPPIKPRRYLGLSMSDVAYRYCDTKRDVYLRRVLKVQGEQRSALVLGQSVHEVLASVSNEIVKLLSLGYKPWAAIEAIFRKVNKVSNLCPQQFFKFCEEVYKAFALDLISDFSDSTSFLPIISEFRVDGTPLGLSSRLSVDAITQLSLVVEIKVANTQEFHKLALAGYALALESALELPIDFGSLIYVNGINKNMPEFKYEVYYISPDLRKEFIDARDEVIDMVSEGRDPGMPTACSPSCPFLNYCNKR